MVSAGAITSRKAWQHLNAPCSRLTNVSLKCGLLSWSTVLCSAVCTCLNRIRWFLLRASANELLLTAESAALFSGSCSKTALSNSWRRLKLNGELDLLSRQCGGARRVTAQGSIVSWSLVHFLHSWPAILSRQCALVHSLSQNFLR